MARAAARLVAVVALAGAASVAVPAAVAPPPAGAARPRVEVVASFYPLAWAAEQVGGRRVSVTNLTPAGVEPHDLELTPDQRDAIEDADVVLVLGNGFQPAVEDAAEDRDRGTIEVLDRLHVDADADPHVWLDPNRMAAIVDDVAAALADADPKRAATYEANAAALRDRLAALDARYRSGLAQCERRLIVTAHEAFGYLAAAYDLRQEGVSGLAPGAEPDPKRLAQLADLVEEKGVTTIFSETLVSPKVAQTLAREAGGLKTATLSPLEGLSAREQRRGDDYVSVMDANLARLQAALGCT